MFNSSFKKSERLLESLLLDSYTRQFLKSDFNILKSFPAIGFRYRTLEPFNDGSFNVIEQFNYVFLSANGDGIDRGIDLDGGIIKFDSELSIVKSYMGRPKNSLSRKLLGEKFDECIGFRPPKKYPKIKSLDLNNSNHDFFYFLTPKNYEEIKKLVQ